MFWRKCNTKSEIYKPRNGFDPAHFIVRRTARQLSILGLVHSEQQFAAEWLSQPDWREDNLNQRYSGEALEFLSNSLDLLALAMNEQLNSAPDEGTAWVARNRLSLVRDLARKVDCLCRASQ